MGTLTLEAQISDPHDSTSRVPDSTFKQSYFMQLMYRCIAIVIQSQIVKKNQIGKQFKCVK